jgi:hypothetical protein
MRTSVEFHGTEATDPRTRVQLQEHEPRGRGSSTTVQGRENSIQHLGDGMKTRVQFQQAGGRSLPTADPMNTRVALGVAPGPGGAVAAGSGFGTAQALPTTVQLEDSEAKLDRLTDEGDKLRAALEANESAQDAAVSALEAEAEAEAKAEDEAAAAKAAEADAKGADDELAAALAADRKAAAEDTDPPPPTEAPA